MGEMERGYEDREEGWERRNEVRKRRRKEGQKKRWEGGRKEGMKEGKKERGRHSRRKASMSDGKMDIVITKWGVWGDLLTNVFLSPILIKINRIS